MAVEEQHVQIPQHSLHKTMSNDQNVQHLQFKFHPIVEQLDLWWKISSGMEGFNRRRKRCVWSSALKAPDKSMSASVPQTTPSADIPHLSKIDCKPKAMGTQLKCAAICLIWIMLHDEIMHGQKEVGRALHVNTPTKQALHAV